MTDFSGQVVLVTGGGSGIGKAIAAAFVHNHAKVIIADVKMEMARKAAREIDVSRASAMPIEMNVCDEASVNTGIDRIHEEHGRIDVLICNAGIQIVHPLASFPFADWKAILAVHLDGSFLPTKACLKYMYAAKSGSIIYMGSVHSKAASPLKAAYVTAKHGLLGLARVVAKEGAPYHVRANVICPGFVRTPLVEKQIPEQARALGISEEAVEKTIMLKDTLDGEFTTVEEVADAVLFCAGFRGIAISGQSLIVSHGWVLE